MPEVTYKCNLCGNYCTKIVFKKDEALGYVPCFCGGVMERTPLKGPTSTVVEIRDNGIMPRRVEQMQDIEEIMKERSKKDDEEKKE